MKIILKIIIMRYLMIEFYFQYAQEGIFNSRKSGINANTTAGIKFTHCQKLDFFLFPYLK